MNDRLVIGRNSIRELLKHASDTVEGVYFSLNQGGDGQFNYKHQNLPDGRRQSRDIDRKRSSDKNSSTRDERRNQGFTPKKGSGKPLNLESFSPSTESDGGDISALLSLVRSQKLPLHQISPRELSEMVGTTSHQGVAAKLKRRIYTPLKDFIQQEQERVSAQNAPSIVLALDSVYDPHNFGAILRSAECFAIDGVVWSRNRGCQITPAVTKVASGASELLPLVSVSNLHQAMVEMQKAGYLVVSFGVGSEGDSLPVQSLSDLEIQSNSQIVCVFGSEGEGIQRLIWERSDLRVKIPMHGKIDSLNVGQSVAVALYAITSKALN